MAAPVFDGGKFSNISATANVTGTSTGNGQLVGFYVNATNAGTLVLKSGGSSGTAMSGTITPAIGFHRYPAQYQNPLHATIAGSALDVTFFYQNL